MLRRTVLQLQGGLGNQLFQIAAGLKIARERKSQLIVDRFSYLRPDMREYELEIFENELGFKSTILGRVYFRPFKLIEEQQEFGFFSAPVPDRAIFKLKGYFQNPTIAPTLIREISEHLILLKDKNISEFCKCPCEHVGVHIRRGDYLSIKENAKNFGVLSHDYYIEAMSRYTMNRVHFIIYSDDEVDFKEIFPTDFFISKAASPEEPVRLLVHMIQNQGFIMSNSSLSWWAAKCIQQNNPLSKIISPSTWFRGNPQSNILIEKEWTRQQVQWLVEND